MMAWTLQQLLKRWGELGGVARKACFLFVNDSIAVAGEGKQSLRPPHANLPTVYQAHSTPVCVVLFFPAF